MGGGRVLAWRSPASCSRPARSAIASAGRGRCSAGSWPSRWARSRPRRRPASGQLIACRAAMGVAAAFIMPVDPVDRRQRVPDRRAAKAIALWAAFTGVAGTIGPVVSGWLLEHFWYGSVFLVNVPIMRGCACRAEAFLVPKSRDPEQSPLDLGRHRAVDDRRSRHSCSPSSRPAVGRLARARRRSPTFGRGARHARALRAVEAAVAEPMLDLRYFRDPAFSTGTGATILVFLRSSERCSC